MLNKIKDFGRFVKLELALRKNGIKKTETDTNIILEKNGRVFKFVKERRFIDNYAKLLGSLAYLVSDYGFLIEEHVLPSKNGSWRYIQIPYHGKEFKIAYCSDSEEKFLFDLYFIQAELDGYLKQYSPKKGDIIIDAGSYHGLFSIFFSDLVGSDGLILCLEPDALNLATLKKNLELNKCSNVIAVGKAIWNKREKLAFSSLGNGGSTLFDQSLGSTSNKSRKVSKNSYVEAVSLQDLITEFNLTKIDFIKMDIEGAEIEAIQGCLEILKKQNINFAIASYHLRDGQKTCHALEEMFKGVGYHAMTDYLQHLTTYASKDVRYQSKS
jgi:FkbM family methyltransferase